ncbi:hypothetical protein H480_37875 [Amycolatopsis vancoresmycina DSM 44592]|uniref:Uncharacterized protein n=1 Tax=Amycolatopsis vancoresmycina DSM 44592 TaxID=1292037 RepID=R1FV28_9PSEU|nr:hypothetical protein H480_37875 [Amycolatopsis vancoresmycina DSM 44592]
MFGDAPDLDAAAAGAGELVEPDQVGLRGRCRVAVAQLVQARDRVAVGGGGRVVEQLDQLALDGLAHHVLPPARLVVHVLPFEPDHVDEEALGEAVLAHHRDGEFAAVVGQLEVPVVGHHDQPVPLHPGDGLAHGRAALLQALGDPGAQRNDTLFFELVDGTQVHLGGVDEIVHAVPFVRVAHRSR